MKNTILITGCTHGLGYSLALRFSQEYKVYAVGRDKKLLAELARQASQIQPIVADITKESDITTIYNAVKKENSLSIIHNAGIAKPCLIATLTRDSLQTHFETNFFAPILITQKLLPLLKKDSRVLHISSKAAELALEGLMHYCVSKAALERATECLNQEFNAKGIYFASLRPGMVDTEMQKQLRESNKNSLPQKDFYVSIKQNNILIPPTLAAEFIFWVMQKTQNKDFSQMLWSIYDPQYRELWFRGKLTESWAFPE